MLRYIIEIGKVSFKIPEKGWIKAKICFFLHQSLHNHHNCVNIVPCPFLCQNSIPGHVRSILRKHLRAYIFILNMLLFSIWGAWKHNFIFVLIFVCIYICYLKAKGSFSRWYDMKICDPWLQFVGFNRFNLYALFTHITHP